MAEDGEAGAASRGGPPRAVVFGAGGRLGRRIAARFAALGHPVVAVGRRRAALDGLPGAPHVLDLDAAPPGDSPVRDGDIAVNAAHARYTDAIIRLCPTGTGRLVVLGSARYLTRLPDRAADEVRAAARRLKGCDLDWVLLHPTMVYGTGAGDAAERIAALIRRFHAVPLPGTGQALIQPVHADDAAEAAVRAATTPGAVRRVIHLAGPEALAYRDFVHAIARAIDCRVVVLSLPLALMRAAAGVTRLLPGVPGVNDAEVLRLQEDKAVDTRDMETVLSLTPRPLEEGLRQAFARPDG